MRQSFYLVVVLAGMLSLSGCEQIQKLTKAQPKLDTDEQKASYAIGLQIGMEMKSQGVKIDTTALASGIRDTLDGTKPRLEMEEIQAAMGRMREKTMAEQANAGKENLEKGNKYLEENKAKPGVKVTESGLQYEVLAEGKGAKAKATDVVKVHYVGTLIDGTKFDSSYDRKEPAEFPADKVIKGWTEALQLMNPGSKMKLTIPASLAYGEQGRPSIPANSVLVFEVELIEIKAAAAKKKAG